MVSTLPSIVSVACSVAPTPSDGSSGTSGGVRSSTTAQPACGGVERLVAPAFLEWSKQAHPAAMNWQCKSVQNGFWWLLGWNVCRSPAQQYATCAYPTTRPVPSGSEPNFKRQRRNMSESPTCISGWCIRLARSLVVVVVQWFSPIIRIDRRKRDTTGPAEAPRRHKSNASAWYS